LTMSAMPIRVLIADDHAIFRSGLRALLEKESDIEVVGETGDCCETIRAAVAEEIDVMLLDISMPGAPGIKVAEVVLKERPHLAIVALTMHEDPHYVQELLRVGARAFVLKKSSGTKLVQAIRAAHRGELYVDSCLSVRGAGGDPIDRGLDLLTQREQEVCRLLAYGHTNAEIAAKLSISGRTVESHRANIMAKLELSSRADLVRFAITNQLLKPA
jgi:DNA-binding NarL/FixJ family response regulator